MVFPAHFIWGAATSSYQIEGAADLDGRGPSIWDVFCQKPGATAEGHSGAVACDHYHRYRDDIGLMAQLGLQAYRFSVNWPRVLPAGIGAINQSGLDFYDRLVDCLLEAGITPYLTVFHWEYPYALYCRGGWLNPDAPAWFADYTALLARRLGDRVKHWLTMNEPRVAVMVGHLWGVHAPGDKLQLSQVLTINHQMLLAHGLGTQAIRAYAPACQIGVAHAGTVAIPVDATPESLQAARLEMFAVTDANQMGNTLWLDPMLLGRYPADALQLLDKAMPPISDRDLATIAQPLDFFGFNSYTGPRVRLNAAGQPEHVPYPPGHPQMKNGWYVEPAVLYWGARLYAERYGLPIIVCENGMDNLDWRTPEGHVHDPQRVLFLRTHLLALSRAISEGVDVQGYFQWSLLDNFEWQDGYRGRFGLVYVDYATQERTLKDSALWYREIIRSNGAALAALPLHKDI